MKWAWCYLLVIFAAYFISTATGTPPGDGDLWWQRRLGEAVLTTHRLPHALGMETFTAAGAPWMPQEWLFGICAFLGRAAIGSAIFKVAVACCAVAAVALTAIRAARRGATPAMTAAAATVTAIALFGSFGVRAQVVAWPLLAAFLLLLELDGPAAWFAIPVAMLWANLHASAMLAFVLAAVATVGCVCDERGWTPRVRRSILIACGVAVALCCNPLGWELPRYAVTLFGSPIRQYINEWRITDVDDVWFVLGALPLLAAALTWGIGTGPRRWHDRFLFGVTAYLLLTAARNIAIFALAVAPLVADSVSRSLTQRGRTAKPLETKRTLDIVLHAAMGLACVAVVVGVIHRPDGLQRPKSPLPLSAVAATERIAGTHNVFCANFAWCSLFLDHPDDRVFIDGRADPFPPAVWKDYADIVTLAADWRTVLTKHRVDTLIVKRDSPLGQAMALLPNWLSAYADPTYRVYVLKPPPRNPSSRQRQMASCNTCGQFEIPLAPASRTVRPRPKIAILRKPMTVVVDRYRYNAPIW